MAAAGNGLALAGPLLSGYAIDAVEPGTGQVNFEKVFFYAGWMVVFYVVSALLSYGLSALMITISRKVVRQMRRDVFDRMLALPVGYFDRHQTGELLSRISYDIDVVNESMSSDLIQMLTTVITVVGALSMMILISPNLVLVFCFTVYYGENPSAVSRPISCPRKAEWIYRGKGYRPKDHQGLLRGGKGNGSVCCQK